MSTDLLPPTGINQIRARLERHGLSLIRMPGSAPEWVVLGLTLPQVLLYRDGQWVFSCPELKAILKNISHEPQQQISSQSPRIAPASSRSRQSRKRVHQNRSRAS